ncbi:MAG TPA: DMT family transporter [Chloroflexi bacterium]|nr:DMT family transporter [Chloroflexota bacterium]
MSDISGASSAAQPQPESSALVTRSGLLLVGLAVLFFSTSPVLVRWAAASLSSYEIAAGRLLLAGLLVLGVAALRDAAWAGLTRWPVFVAIGLVAAVHFGAYIGSLSFTTIAHSLALVYTAPIFAALLSWWLLGESLRPRQWLGIVIAVVGVAIMAGFTPNFDRTMLIGDALALVSAITFAIYSIAGRRQRHHVSLLVYAGAVYLAGGLWLLPMAALNFSAGGYTLPAILSVVALAVVPLGLGHTLYNAALRRMRATSVNLLATQEVTGGVLLGIFLLGEIPSFVTVVGIAVTLVGIILVLLETP